MIKFKTSIILIMPFFLVISVFAQSSDTTSSDQDDFVESIEWAWGSGGEFSPFLEGNYGYVLPQNKKFTSDLQHIGMAELKLGYSSIKPYRGLISDIDERFIFGSYVAKDLNYFDDDQLGVEIEIKRFGFGNRLGYGYDVGPVALLFYHQGTFVWSRLHSDTTQIPNQEEIGIINRYQDTYRFGISMEGGIKFDLLKSLAATASYELSVIYPRHIFWEWFASYTIMYAGIGAVSVFSEDIVDSSPLLGSLFYFVLKNGISYAIFQGMKENMNWPFASESPLTL